jgi:hypothetical protein
MSKHHLLEHWPQSEFVQGVAKIVMFAQFYGKFIPYFELQIAQLCNLITKLDYRLVWAEPKTIASSTILDLKKN